jgi:cellulose synthase/poly-beta-1,6-N-acetylglucosamine synthase-like glycosyltransferase
MEITSNSLLYFLTYSTFAVYSLSLILILIYSLTQLNMLRYFLKYQKNKQALNTTEPKAGWPKVTVQLPLYNELYVVERLLECITALDYPKDKLQIQVLDDSADESLELTQKLVRAYQAKGIPIIHIHRKERKGFKAGALKEGLETASGELIAIFDSDFLPESDWLYKTVPQFENAKVGVVQTRWGHLNRTYSPWTSVQAFALDAHFLLEQIGRNQQQYFINFNGTAGVWRKSCILDAGNWEGDTLTEDLDLSYRAQLKNWKFVYLDEVVTPAELPITLDAIRSQQFRWNKGGAENFQKMISRVMKSKNLSWKVKFNAAVHLLNSTMFFNVLIVSLLSVPVLFIKAKFDSLGLLFDLSGLFILSTLIFYTCYWFVHRTVFGSGIASFFHYTRRFLLFYCLVIGFSIHNSVAVLEGHLGIKSPFIRTPKFNLNTNDKTVRQNKYRVQKTSIYTFIEVIFAFYFLFGLYSAFELSVAGEFWLFPFHLLLFIGFSSIYIFGLRQSR